MTTEERREKEEERKGVSVKERKKNYTFIYFLVAVLVIGAWVYFFKMNRQEQKREAEQQRMPAEARKAEDKHREKGDAEEFKRQEEERKRAEASGMVFVKGGCFQMGDIFGGGDLDEKPVHEVCVDDFYIGRYEVTQGQWKEVMGGNPSEFNNCGENCPVERVSWEEVQKYIGRLRQRTGIGYRLPTEAEWEYACRSGGKKEKYSGGSNADSVAWHRSISGNKTHPVGTKSPNGLGIYDMSGNVYEWVSDRWDSNYYNSSPKQNPKGPNSGSFRVDRGGSWINYPRDVRCSYRHSNPQDSSRDRLGFRLAVD